MSDIAKELAEKIIHAQRQYAGGQFYSMLAPIIRETLDPVLQALNWYGEIAESAAKQTDTNYKLALFTELALDNGRRAKKARGI